jgi:hypothetical protein
MVAVRRAVRRAVPFAALALAAVIALAAGLVLAGTASAASPSPASGATVLRVGWDTEPDPVCRISSR